MIVTKHALYVPVTDEQWEFAQWFRWTFHGTTGDPALDARFAAESAEALAPWNTWESEGGAL